MSARICRCAEVVQGSGMVLGKPMRAVNSQPLWERVVVRIPTIRPATETDLERLVDVEVEAGQLFHAVGMSLVAEDVPQIADLREAVADERIWVTAVGAEVAGYITAEVIDGNAHVAQVSVVPDHARRGIGKAMIDFVEAWGRTSGCPATTLTTFSDVPWNAPYYLRLGYEVLSDNQIGPELARTMEHEASLPGIDASLRCAMIKANDPTSTGTANHRGATGTDRHAWRPDLPR